MQVDVRQQGRDHSPLRRPLLRLLRRLTPSRFVLFNHRDAQPLADQLQNAAIGHPHPHTGHQLVVRNAVKVTFQVRVIDFRSSRPEVPPDPFQRVIRFAARAKSMRALLEIGLKDRIQYQHHRHLHHAVFQRGDSKRSLRSVGFWDIDSFNRARAVPWLLFPCAPPSTTPRSPLGAFQCLCDGRLRRLWKRGHSF